MIFEQVPVAVACCTDFEKDQPDVPVAPREKKHRRRAANMALSWCDQNAAQYQTKEEAHQACKFVVGGMLIGLILETVFSWILWKVLDYWWEHRRGGRTHATEQMC